MSAFVVHGIAALAIILFILLLLVLGLITLFKLLAKGATRTRDRL